MKVASLFLAAALAQAAQADPRQIPITCKSAAAVAGVVHAQSLLDNVRVAEAVVALKQALAKDPQCATVHSLLATVLPLGEAAPHLAFARAHLAGLPEAERAQIEIVLAGFDNDIARGRALTAQLVGLAPDDFRAHLQLGGQALGDRDFEKAVAENGRAIELNPAAAAAYNNLGYAYAGQYKYDDAAATFRKYAEVQPKEPNAHDSLAEVLMNGGHLAEAEAEFQAALALDAHFAGAWTGIAQTRLMRGDEAGADAALVRELSADPRPPARLGAEINIAYALLAEGKVEQAMKKMDQLEKKALKEKLPQRYFLDAIQARLQVREGNAEKALALARASLKRVEDAQVEPGNKQALLRGALIEVVRAEALAGHKAEAQKALARMEEAVGKVPGNAFLASQLEDTRGTAALAADDAAAAVTALARCLEPDFQCQYDLVRAKEQAGDAQGAAASRAAFLKTPLRGIEYVYLWKKLGGVPGGGSTAGER